MATRGVDRHLRRPDVGRSPAARVDGRVPGARRGRSRLRPKPRWTARNGASSSSGVSPRTRRGARRDGRRMQLFDVRRRFFRRQASEAAEFLDRRELTKAAYLQLGGLLRRCHLEFGRRLVARRTPRVRRRHRVRRHRRDRIAVRRRGPTLQTIARRRQFNREANQSPPLPLVWTGLPPAGVRRRRRSASGSRAGARAPGATKESLASCTRPRRRSSVAARSSSPRRPMRRGRRCSWRRARSSSNKADRCRTPRSSLASSGCRPWSTCPGFVARLEREGGTAPVVVDGTAGVVTIQPTATGDEPDEQLPAAAPSPAPDVDAPTVAGARSATAVRARRGLRAGAGSRPALGRHDHADERVRRRSHRRRRTDVGHRRAHRVHQQHSGPGASASPRRTHRTHAGRRRRRRIRRRRLQRARRSPASGLRDCRRGCCSSSARAIPARSTDLYFDGDIGPVGWALTRHWRRDVARRRSSCRHGRARVAPGADDRAAARAWYPSEPDARFGARSRTRARIAIAVMASLVRHRRRLRHLRGLAGCWRSIGRSTSTGSTRAAPSTGGDPTGSTSSARSAPHRHPRRGLRHHVPALPRRRNRVPAHDRGRRSDLPHVELDRASPSAPVQRARRRAHLISRRALDPGRARPPLTAPRRVGAHAQPVPPRRSARSSPSGSGRSPRSTRSAPAGTGRSTRPPGCSSPRACSRSSIAWGWTRSGTRVVTARPSRRRA